MTDLGRVGWVEMAELLLGSRRVRQGELWKEKWDEDHEFNFRSVEIHPVRYPGLTFFQIGVETGRSQH